MIPSIFEYLPKESLTIWKMAEEKEPIKNPIAHGLKTIGTGLAFMGLGTVLGYGGGILASKAVKNLTGKEIPASSLQVPIALASIGMGYAYNKYKAKELEELRRAAESYRNRPKRVVSGQ